MCGKSNQIIDLKGKRNWGHFGRNEWILVRERPLGGNIMHQDLSFFFFMDKISLVYDSVCERKCHNKSQSEHLTPIDRFFFLFFSFKSPG